MTTPHLEDLQRLRALTIEQRRKLVGDLTRPSERGSAQDLRELFLKLQETIEAVDRAIKDESGN